MMKQIHFSLLAVGLMTVLTLSACESAKQSTLRPIDSATGMYFSKQKRLKTAAAAAIASGDTEEALEKYKRLHGDKTKDKDTAVNYAQLLRSSGHLDKALSVLAPHVPAEEPQPQAEIDQLIQTEYAACLTAAGRYDEAETHLNNVLGNAAAAAFHADAYNLMGVTLDAQGRSREAETMFQKSLDRWGDNPTTVMNNLALNFAHRGKFDQSLTMLRKALVMDPGNKRIAENIQIVSKLRDSIIPKAPVKIRK